MNLANQGLITTSTFGTGNAGSLFVNVGKLSLQNQSLITSSTAGAGDAGKLNIRASDSVEVLSGSRIASETVGSGNGADLTVVTGRLVTRNGDISTSTIPESSGRGGDLRVVASDSIDISGEVGTAVGGLYSSTLGSGQGGNLTVETARLSVRDGGRIEAGTGGIAPGGNVTVNASDSIELIGTSAVGILPNGVATVVPSGISSFSLQLGSADGGDVNLTTGNLTIQDSAEVTTRSEGKGKAGDISANVRNNLRLSRGNITATSLQAGGGDINLTADDTRLSNSSLISTSVKESTGGGGNITINSKVFLAIEDSDILANAEAEPGGDIFINSDAFLADIFSRGAAVPVGRNPGDFARFRNNDRVDISADSRTGKRGTVTYPNIEQIRGVPALPSDLVDAEGLIDRHCSSNSSAKQSSFTITGCGGLQSRSPAGA